MPIEIPEYFMGQPIKGSLKRVLDRLEAEKNNGGKPQTPSNLETAPRQGMIYVPSINLSFQPERTHLGKDWYQAHEALNQENLRMPTIPEFIEFLKVLRADAKYSDLYKDITELRSPWRLELLDAYFPEINGKLHIQYHNQIQNGQIISGTPEELKDCLMKDKTPGISLEDWLDNPTKQGMPRADAQDGNLYYGNPRKDCVAGLYVCSGRLSLGCDWDPSGRNVSLGVFGCAEGTAKK
jgi:hypothetical protein